MRWCLPLSFLGNWCSCMRTAVMGDTLCSLFMAMSILRNFPSPATPLTFLETKRGPGCGSTSPHAWRSGVQLEASGGGGRSSNRTRVTRMVVRSCSRRRIRGQLRWGWGEGGLCRGQAALRGRVRHSELVPAHACCSSCGRVRHSELVPPSHATFAVRPRHRRACRFRRGGGSGVLTSGRPSWSRRRPPAFSSCGSPTRRSPRRGARPWTCRRSSSRTGSSCGSPRGCCSTRRSA